jgi:hypothetical protein
MGKGGFIGQNNSALTHHALDEYEIKPDKAVPLGTVGGQVTKSNPTFSCTAFLQI